MAGPGESTMIATATAIQSGSVSTRNSAATTTSSARFSVALYEYHGRLGRTTMMSLASGWSSELSASCNRFLPPSGAVAASVRSAGLRTEWASQEAKAGPLPGPAGNLSRPLRDSGVRTARRPLPGRSPGGGHQRGHDDDAETRAQHEADDHAGEAGEQGSPVHRRGPRLAQGQTTSIAPSTLVGEGSATTEGR